MKIQMNYFSVAFCAAMLAAGCTQYEAPSVHADGKGMQVPLVITTAGIESEVTHTRTASELGTGASVGLFLSNVSGSNSYVPRDNVHYKHTAGGWQFQGTAEDGIFLNASDVGLCAYYPYDASVTSAAGIRITPHELAPGEIPLAYAPNRWINAVNNNVTFSMKQAYTWLAVSFRRGNIKDDITLGEFSLINNGLYKESVLDIGDGTIGGNIPADTGAISFTGDIALAKNGTVTRDIVVPPTGELSGGLKVAVKVKEYDSKVLSTTLAGITGLERGYRYEVTLTVNGTELGVSSVNVLPWTITTVNDGGAAWVPEPVIPYGVRVPASEINLGGSDCTVQDKADLSLLRWAEGNLTNDENDLNVSYTWATPTASGYYYTFKSTYAAPPGRNDPCTKLNSDLYGTGWRTPSSNELTKLVRCTDKQVVSNNGVMGMWFMNNPDGLFLPAAGRRTDFLGNASGTAPTGGAGTGGFYWSSDTHGSSFAHYLYFGSGYTFLDNGSRTDGLSVRCVKGTRQ